MRHPGRFHMPAVGRRVWSSTLLVLLVLTAFDRRAAAAQQPPAEPPASEPVTARPPAVNRLNDVLPGWMRVRGEFRGRLEGVENAGFTEGRDDLYWLNRFRFDVSVTPVTGVALYAEVQDARVARKDIGSTGSPFRAPFDLRQAYAELGGASSPVNVRVGRQELVFGEQRLVGHVSWLNAARTFDGVRATLGRGQLRLTAFAASVVRILDGAFDRSGNGNRFYGGNLVVPGLAGSAIEPYVFWRGDQNVRTESGPSGDLALVSVGARATGRLPGGTEYGVETVVQRGSAGTDDVRAWAGHYQLKSPSLGGTQFVAEYNYASGDRDSSDGIRGTFDQLYPTPHDKYGLTDQVGWRNIHHVRAGAELGRWRGWPITLNYHTWWLAERTDALYSAGGAPVARVPAGTLNRHVGHELDVQVRRALTPQLQLAGGYAHLFAGPFLDEATPGASYRFPYAMLTYVFLADR